MKKQSLMEKIKGLSKGKKIGLGIAAVVVIGALAMPADEEANKVEANAKPQVEQNDAKEEKAPEKEEEKKDESKEIYNKDGIKITFKGLGKDYMGQTIKLNIENNTKVKKTIQIRDLSINGYMIDGIFSPSIEGGKKANDDISILKTYLEKNDITEIKEIELKFAIMDSDNIMNSINTEVIKINL